MIKVTLVCVGKVKEKYFKEGIEEYSKRLSKYCDFKIVELAEENYSKVDEGLVYTIKQKEGEKISSHLGGYVFCTAIEGIKYSSPQLAGRIKALIDKGREITFVIGGSYGVSDEVKKKCNELISFSDMTFPHTMFRLICAEQLYRAFSIIGGSSYHK